MKSTWYGAIFGLAGLLPLAAQADTLGKGLTYYYNFDTNTAATYQNWDDANNALSAAQTDHNLPFGAAANFGTASSHKKTNFGEAMSGGGNGTRVYNKDATWLNPCTSATDEFTLSMWFVRAASSANKPSILVANAAFTGVTLAAGGVTDDRYTNSQTTNQGWALVYKSSTSASGANGTGTPIFRFSTTTDGTNFTFHTITSSTTFAEGLAQTSQANWHHIAVTLKRSADETDDTVTLYLNGANVGTTTVAHGSYFVIDTTTKLYMNTADSGQGQQNCQDDLAIWSRALAPSEIAALGETGGTTTACQPLSTIATNNYLASATSATVATGDWAGFAWDPTVADWTAASGYDATLATAAGVESTTLPDSLVLNKLILTGADPLTIANGATAPTIGTVDASATTGAIIFSNALGAANVTAGANTTLAGGTGVLTIASGKKATLTEGWSGTIANTGTLEHDYAVVNVGSAANAVKIYSAGTSATSATGAGSFAPSSGGELYLSKGDFYFASSANSATTTTAKLSAGATLNFNETYDAANGSTVDNYFTLGTVNFTMEGGAIRTGRFTLSQGANGRVANFTQEGGDVVVTGNVNTDANTAAIMFGHWDGPSTYTMNGGTFTAENARVLVGKTANNHAWYIGPGAADSVADTAVANVKGIYYSGGATGTNTLQVRKGGKLVVGDVGVNRNGKTVNFKVDGTLGVSENATVNIPMSTYYGATLDVPADKTMTVSAVISDASEASTPKVTKTGAGGLALTAENTFTGGLDVQAGNVTVGANNRMKLVGIAEDATLTLTLTDAEKAANAVSFPTSLTEAPAKERFVVMNGDTAVTIDDDPTITDGVLTIALPIVSPTMSTTSNWSTADAWSSGEVPTTGEVILNGGTDGITVTLDTAIPAEITKIGVVGKVTFVTSEAQSTIPAVVTLTEGSEIEIAAAFSGAWTQPANTTLTINNANDAALTIAQVITSTGNVHTKGNVTLSGASTYRGSFTVDSGTCTLTTAGTGLTGTVEIAAGATLTTATTDGIGYAGTATITVKGTLDLSNKRWSIGANNRLNIYEGASIIGTGDANAGLDIFSANTLHFYASDDNETNVVTVSTPIRYRAVAVTFDVPAGLTVNVTGDATNTQNTGSLVKTGAGALTVSPKVRMYTGTTTVSAGNLTFGFNLASNFTIQGAITVASGASLTFNANSQVTLSGALTTNGTLTKTGTGVLIPNGTTAGTGAWTIAAGTVKPNTTSTRTGNLTVATDAILDLSTAAGQIFTGTTHDGSSILTLNGTLKTREWTWGETGPLGKLAHDANKLVINGGTVEFTASMESNRGYNIGANGATFVLPEGFTYTLPSAATAPTGANALKLTGAGTYGFAKNVPCRVTVAAESTLRGTATLTNLTFEDGATLDATANTTTAALTATTLTVSGALNVKVAAEAVAETLIIKTGAPATDTVKNAMVLTGNAGASAKISGNNYLLGMVVIDDPAAGGTGVAVTDETAKAVIIEAAKEAGISEVTTVTGKTQTGADAPVALDADAVAAALDCFTGAVTITVDTEDATKGAAEVAYNFGITKMALNGDDASKIDLTVGVVDAAGASDTIVMNKGATLTLMLDGTADSTTVTLDGTAAEKVITKSIADLVGKTISVKISK